MHALEIKISLRPGGDVSGDLVFGFAFFLFFGFGIHTPSVPSTAETHTGGGAVLGKPGGSPARRHSRNTVLTSAYADIQTNKE